MTFEQYWHDDCDLVKSYRQAQKIRNEHKNTELWLQGMYFYDALCKASPIFHAFAPEGTKPEPYPGQPYPLSIQEADWRAAEDCRQKRAETVEGFAALAAMINYERSKRGEGNERERSNNR